MVIFTEKEQGTLVQELSFRDTSVGDTLSWHLHNRMANVCAAWKRK
jgi:hypothetical protein